MLYHIRHTTEYRFSRPVFFEPHQFRFQPRNGPSHRLLQFDLTIEPTPAGSTRALDPEGNVVTLAWFDGLHEQMTVLATCKVETLRSNPFDYLATKQNSKLPVEYLAWETEQLAPALHRVGAPAEEDPVREVAEQLRDATGGEVIPFLTQLTSTIFERNRVEIRETGMPWTPLETWQRREGACRDVAMLFVDACRAVGLAARFVSGYQEGDPDQDERHLHAWAEVYLPGAGWRGYDPTLSLTVADSHIAIAASTDPEHAAPVTATYRGTGVESELRSELLIDAAPSASAQ